MSELQLKPYQKEIVKFINENPRCMIAGHMGIGKTLTSLYWFSLQQMMSPVKMLVISTKRVVQKTWPDEINKFDDFKDFTYSVIVGNKAEREKALAKDVDIYLVNFEQLPWLVDELDGSWPFKIVIVDESTKLKGFRPRQGTKRARALAKVAHKHVDRFVALTGTPSPNGLLDLYGQFWFINPNILGLTWQGFTQRYFSTVRVGATPQAVRYVPLPHSQTEIQALIKPYTYSLDPNDWFDLEEPITNKIYVDLPPDARKLYDEMERKMFIELGESEVEAFNAASKAMKCLQMASGSIYTDGHDYEVIHSAKIEALESVIEEAAGTPVLVAYHFKSDLDRLLKAFPQGKALDQNLSTIDDFNTGRIPLLFLHPASAGHGLSLHHGTNIICFYSMSFSLENYLQAIERIGPTRQAQAGYKRPVFIHHIISTNTVDELVYARLNTKREVQDLLLEYMKGNKNDARTKNTTSRECGRGRSIAGSLQI
jgi:SNF2 family DNA or RNA helicase